MGRAGSNLRPGIRVRLNELRSDSRVTGKPPNGSPSWLQLTAPRTAPFETSRYAHQYGLQAALTAEARAPTRLER